MITVRSAVSGLAVQVYVAGDAPARLSVALPESVGASGSLPPPPQPMVEVLAAGHGRAWSSTRYVGTQIGERLRYVSHNLILDGPWQELHVVQRDEVSGLDVTSVLWLHDAATGVRSVTRVHNGGSEPVVLQAVTSLVFADFGSPSTAGVEAMTLVRGRNDWLAEGRWHEEPLRQAGLPGLRATGKGFRTRGSIRATSLSSWSTAEDLPMGVLVDHARDTAWAWQVEHNGAWHWQLGELDEGLYFAGLGPTDEESQWSLELDSGDTFESVPVAIAIGCGGMESAVAALTGFRRVSRRAHTAADSLPVVFNDYMNTTMGDPTTARLLPLVEAAAAAGAEYFVIDAGWYDDDGDWWDSVGEWQPSVRRFPGGLNEVLDSIRHHRMLPGLWLEPEVVGVRSPMAAKLPDAAFMQRFGRRIVEHGRYHLDFSNEEARRHMDDVVDRLVADHGIAYLKLDYNIRAGAGSDASTPAAGHGLLQHNRAYLQWIDGIIARHPTLNLENCASGGMRQDFALLSRVDVQSTSDQEDFLAYAAIAAAAPMLVLPEQAANWAYPQLGMSDEDVTYTLATSVLGRFYLSGWLHRLSGPQQALVREAVQVNKALRARLPHLVPFWPLELPGWGDPWLAVGMIDSGLPETAYVTIWRRPDAAPTATLSLPLLPDGRRWERIDPVFPAALSPWSIELAGAGCRLHVRSESGAAAARVVKLTAESS